MSAAAAHGSAQPAAAQVAVYVLHEPATLPPVLAERAQAWLSDEERERWQRFLRAADRDRFLLSRLLLRGTLGRLMGLAPAALQFTRTDHGKPRLVQQATDVPLHFNLSHTHGLLALAVSHEAELGVDVESTARDVAMLALAERFFSEAEVEMLRSLAGAALRERFFVLWTLKEAYVKACGVGLSLGLDTFAFQFSPAAAPRLVFAQHDDVAQWSFHLQHIEAFQLAVAVRAPCVSVITEVVTAAAL